MDTVLKIYSDVDFSVIEVQLINATDLKWSFELVGVGELTFLIDVDDPVFEKLFEFKRLTLFEIKEGDDIYIWSGFITEFDFDVNFCRVICQQEKGWLKNKILFTAKSFDTKTLQFIADEILGESNTRSDPTESLLMESFLSGTVGTTPDPKKFSAGQDYYAVFQDIIDQLEGEWTVKFNKITADTTIGTDRTSGDNFFELIFNVNSPNENNLSNVNNIRSSNEIATSILGGDGTAFASDNITGSQFGTIERFISYGLGDLQKQVTADLQKKSVSQREIDVDIVSTLNPDVDVGDLVLLRIDANNVNLNFNGSIKVIGKRVESINGQPRTVLQLSDITKPIENAKTIFQRLASDVRKLQTL